MAEELHELIFWEPYADRAELDKKYYRRAPDAALRRPGHFAWMTLILVGPALRSPPRVMAATR